MDQMDSEFEYKVNKPIVVGDHPPKPIADEKFVVKDNMPIIV